jgi:hypothetical protein
MYFAKFFHKAPGDDDRLLLLAVGSDTLMGVYLKEIDYRTAVWSDLPPGANLPGEFLRQEFGTINESVGAFRREAETLRAAGYIETHHTKYTLRDLEGDFTPKPEWQRALDEAIMAAFADRLDVQADRLAALAGTPAAGEPIALWLAAHHAKATKQLDTLKKAEWARDALLQREAGGAPHYTWSLFPHVIKGYIYELLADCYLDAEPPDPWAALEAITTAREADPNETRLNLWALIICECFPEREEDAYDSIHPWAHQGGYEEITSRPSYAAYAARRAKDAAAGRGTWRWGWGRPQSEAEIAAAEGALGVTFPDGYRRFLRERGQCDLFVRLPKDDARLGFAAADQLWRSREDFIDFVALADSEANVAQYFRDEHGVGLRHLIPIAVPSGASNLLLLHTEPGDSYGSCYVWNHDDAWDLVNEQPSFEAMIAMLLAGIERPEAVALDLFNISVEAD